MKNLTFLLSLIVMLLSGNNLSFAQAGAVTTVAGGGASIADGIVATSALILGPRGVGVDAAGNVYFVDKLHYKVRKVNSSTGIISTVAGNGLCCLSTGDGGPATAAGVGRPEGLFVDPAGNILIADSAFRIRRVDVITGIISTVAGGGSSTADGIPATSADIGIQKCVFADNAGNIYCSGINSVRKIDASTGIITTVAGGGSSLADGVPATTAAFPFGAVKSICLDGDGNIYIVPGSGSSIRKVNAITGLITTIAGGGFSSVNGIPATASRLTDVNCCRVDIAGNIFVADSMYRIRRIDAGTGLINTIAGGGSSLAEGIPALGAYTQPYHLCLDQIRGYIYFSHGTDKVRRFSFSPLYGTTSPSDSFKVAVNRRCNGPELTVVTPHYVAGRSIKTDFGDGNTDSSVITPGFLSGGYAVVKHSYSTTGTYTVRQTLYYGALVVDTVTYTYYYDFCRSLPVQIFYDGNANCVKDIGESPGIGASLVKVDSNGVPVDTMSATSGFSYNAYSTPGAIYRFSVISAPGNLTATCPSSGFILDTISATTGNYPVKYFGMACTTTSTFDLQEHAIVPVTGRNDQWGNIYVRNNSCNPTTGTLTLHFSPKYVYTGGARPTPSSASGNTITWNLSTMNAEDPSPVNLYYVVWHNPVTGYLTSGDTVQEHITIAPIAGDGNPSNNSQIKIDTVRASCDPNDISVSPAGCIASGVSATELTYTVRFENTGTDTAHNIYVMDTLSDFLDPSTLRLVMATHNMDIDIQTGSGHGVVKFDFPNIKLLDSSYHGECDGAIIYTIKTRPGLAPGTHILNHAGIYFDYNDAVLTNVADNVIGCPIALNTPLVAGGRFEIYPNPATTELTIKTDKDAYDEYSIANSVGQVLMQQQRSAAETKVSINRLAPGLYYLTLRGERGVKTRKFVKM